MSSLYLPPVSLGLLTLVCPGVNDPEWPQGVDRGHLSLCTFIWLMRQLAVTSRLVTAHGNLPREQRVCALHGVPPASTLAPTPAKESESL